MFDVMSIAASGMRAADMRLQAAARNIANASTVGSLPNAVGAQQTKQVYRPVEVIQASLDGGGVKADFREREDATVEIYSPSSVYADARGLVAAPKVDMAKELTDVVQAEMNFKANAMLLGASAKMFDALLDAFETRDDHRTWRLSV